MLGRRASALITGREPGRLRVGLDEPLAFEHEETIGLPTDIPTLPSLLRQRGYRTSLFGKWHLGKPPKFGPLKSGYDRFFGMYGGYSFYFGHGKDDPSPIIDRRTHPHRPRLSHRPAGRQGHR